MTDSFFIRWSKGAAVVAGLLWPVVFVTALLVALFTGGLDNPAPPSESLEPGTLSMAALFYIPSVLMAISLVGIHARYRNPWGVLGQLGVVLGLFSLIITPLSAAVGIAGTPQDFAPSAIGEMGILWAVRGTILLGAGFIVFGMAALKSATPSRKLGMILVCVGLFQPAILYVSQLRVFAYSFGWIVLGWALPKAQDPSGPAG